MDWIKSKLSTHKEAEFTPNTAEVWKTEERSGWFDVLFGDYDYKTMFCAFRNPFAGMMGKKTKNPAGTFFGLNEPLPLMLALIMGFQHTIAMLGGLITPPIVIGGSVGLSNEDITYMVSASFMASGILTIVQVAGFRIPRTNFQIGSGLLSVEGTSFAFVETAKSSISLMTSSYGYDVRSAYGAFLGTCALCGVWEVLLSFFPIVLSKIFPPLVTGVTVTLLGLKLVGVGFTDWGGGADCYYKPPGTLCQFGDFSLPFGSAALDGLGFLTFTLIVIIEIFGSPLMRNCSIALGLLISYGISAAIGYVDATPITTAPPITFLWTTTFPLGLFVPAIIPLIVAFTLSLVETIGVLKSTAEVSRVETDGPEFNRRMQGGLLADGLCGTISPLMTNPPTSTFSQNNGVIALTGTCSRRVGFAACFWLTILGILSKLGGVFIAIPKPVLGGMTTCLFASVMVSGLALCAEAGFGRRNRFIQGMAFGIGLGVVLVPRVVTENLWPISSDQSGFVRSIRDSVITVLSNGFCMGMIVSTILNGIIPEEAEEELDSMEPVGQDNELLSRASVMDKPGTPMSMEKIEMMDRTSTQNGKDGPVVIPLETVHKV